jgi:hypothetical protein
VGKRSFAVGCEIPQILLHQHFEAGFVIGLLAIDATDIAVSDVFHISAAAEAEGQKFAGETFFVFPVVKVVHATVICYTAFDITRYEILSIEKAGALIYAAVIVDYMPVIQIDRADNRLDTTRFEPALHHFFP